jgi:micrococcal nuclease
MDVTLHPITAMVKRFFAALAFFFVLHSFAAAQTRVIDGDTFVLNGQRIRIHALDCPELHQPGGPEAKRALKNLLRKPVTIQRTGRKTWGRTVAIVYSGKRDVACRLIASGTCKRWPRYDMEGRYVRCQK